MSIPYYQNFLSSGLIHYLIDESESVEGIQDLYVAKGLQTEFPTIENGDALKFVCRLYEQTKPHLKQILAQRSIDRAFIDKKTIS